MGEMISGDTSCVAMRTARDLPDLPLERLKYGKLQQTHLAAVSARKCKRLYFANSGNGFHLLAAYMVCDALKESNKRMKTTKQVNDIADIGALFDADNATDNAENAARGNALENAENAAIAASVPKYAPKLTAAMIQTGRAVDTATAVQSYSALWARLRDNDNNGDNGLITALAECLNTNGGTIFYSVAGRAAAAHDWGTERDENGAEIAAAYSVRVGGTDGKGENVAEIFNETFPAFNLPYTIKSVKMARQIVYRLRRIARGRTWAQIVAMERAAKNATATAAKLSDEAAKLRAKLAEVERAAEMARRATETK